MKCVNCGRNDANIKYTRIINGKKTEMILCEECAKAEGIDDLDFNMPIDFSNFISDFFEDDFMLPSFQLMKEQNCSKCGLTFESFVKSGKLGCSECYNVFSNKIDSVLKNLHGTSTHKGRAPKILNEKNKENFIGNNENTKKQKIENETENKINNLNIKLQEAIKEERYEEAAKIRDEIKQLKGKEE